MSVRAADDTNCRYAFGPRLAALLQARSMTQADFAKRSGIHPAAVSFFVQGAREPSLQNLRRICLALECSADELLGLDIVQEGLARERLKSFKHWLQKCPANFWAPLPARE